MRLSCHGSKYQCTGRGCLESSQCYLRYLCLCKLPIPLWTEINRLMHQLRVKDEMNIMMCEGNDEQKMG